MLRGVVRTDVRSESSVDAAVDLVLGGVPPVKCEASQAADSSLFRPLVVLAIALVAALLFAIAVASLFQGEPRRYLLFYFVPVAVPFVACVFDRAERRGALHTRHWAIDVPVLGLALTRIVVAVPFVSGHALFLTYALLTTRAWVARGTAFLVLLQVAYLKIAVWHDAGLFGGIALGVVAALCFGIEAMRAKS